MKLDILSKHMVLDGEVLGHIRERFEHSLDHFAHYILEGRIVLSDVNGPKGGVDKHCLVHVRLRWVPDIIVKEEGVELFSVVDGAANRVAIAVGRAIEKVRESRRHENSQATV